MDYKNILIVKLSAIGDVIHALPVANALKKRYPSSRITWVVEKPAYDLLTNNPNIDEIIVFNKPDFKTLGGLIQHAPAFINTLRSRNFDVSLDLQGLFKSAAISFCSGATERYVYCNARELSHLLGRRICGPHQQGHIVEQYLDVARALNCQVAQAEWSILPTAAEVMATEQAAAMAGLHTSQPYIVLIPGANWPNKRWDPVNYGAVADWLWHSGVTPVVVGAPTDQPLFTAIADGCTKPPVNLVGKTTLKGLAYILQKAQAAVGGDTGPMHLAAAVQTPVVALMGPTDVPRNGPYGQGHSALMIEKSCYGCWKRACPRGEDCLAGIDTSRVTAALQVILERHDITCRSN